MHVETNKITQLKISDVPILDYINVYIEKLPPDGGRIIIECYGRVWANYWSATSGIPIERFFISCDNDYLVSKFAPSLKGSKKEYLIKIIEAVKLALSIQYN